LPHSVFLKTVRNTEITAIGIRSADHATPFYPRKLTLTSPTSGGRSVGIVRSPTKTTKLLLLISSKMYWVCGLVVKSSWLHIQRAARVRFPALPDFLRSSGSGTGSTQSREYNWGATSKKSSGSGLENREYGRRDPSQRQRGTLYPQTLALTLPTSTGRSVGIVHSRTQTMEYFLLAMFIWGIRPASLTKTRAYYFFLITIYDLRQAAKDVPFNSSFSSFLLSSNRAF
jgi:hypothetical protein